MLTDGGALLERKRSVVRECDCLCAQALRTESQIKTLSTSTGLSGTKTQRSSSNTEQSSIMGYILGWLKAPSVRTAFFFFLTGAQICAYNNISYCESKTVCALLGSLPSEMVHWCVYYVTANAQSVSRCCKVWLWTASCGNNYSLM